MEWQEPSLGSQPSKPSAQSPAKLSSTRRISSLLQAASSASSLDAKVQLAERDKLSRPPLKRSHAASRQSLARFSEADPTAAEPTTWPTEPSSAGARLSATAEEDVVDLEDVATRLIAAIDACEAALELIGYEDATSDAEEEEDVAADPTAARE